MSKFAKLKVARTGGVEEDEALSPMDKRIERKLVSTRGILITLGVLGLVVLFSFAYIRYGLNRTLTMGAERLTISQVEYGLFREYIPVTGNIVPHETVYLDAIEGGQVTEVLVEEGAMVDAGQSLLTLKNTNLQLNVISSEAQLSEQLNNLQTTRLSFEQNRLRHRRELISLAQQIDTLERELGRREKLVESGAVAMSELEDREATLRFLRMEEEAIKEAQAVDLEMQSQQMEQLETAVERISANLDIARENLDNLVMKAPISGQLTIFDANLGESKAPGERIGQIDDISGFKVSAYIDEFYLNRVVLGQVAEVPVDGRSYALEVTKIYPNVRDRQFQVELEFVDTEPTGIRRGQTLRMNLEIGAQSESLVLANGAYVDDTGGSWVFVVSPDNSTAERRVVSVGRRNPEMVEVTSGLDEGERVITSGYDQLKDFDRIDLRQDN